MISSLEVLFGKLRNGLASSIVRIWRENIFAGGKMWRAKIIICVLVNGQT
jgi:hypothetical protein